MSMWSKEALGGKYFLRFRDYLWLIPGMYVFSALSRRFRPGEPELFYWFIADTVALAGMTVWFLIGQHILFRHRATKPAPFAAVVGFGAVLGGLKGSLTALAGFFFGLEPDIGSAFETRVVQTTLVGAWIVPVVSIVAAFLAKLESERDQAVRARIIDVLSRPWEVATLVSQHTDPVVENLVKQASTKDPHLSPDEVRTIVDDTVKPLSKKLWGQVGRQLPPYRPRHLFSVFFSGYPRSVWLAIAVWSATTWPAMVALHTLPEANLAVLAIGLSAALVYGLIRPIRPGTALRGIALHLFATATAVTTGGVLIGLIDSADSSVLQPETLISSWMWLFLVVMNAGAAQVLRDSRKQVAKEIARLQPFIDAGDDYSADNSAVITARLANILHSEVQNKLLALADSAEGRGGNIPLGHLIDAMTAHNDLGEGANSSLKTKLDDVAERWSGVISVDYTIADSVSWLGGTGLDAVVVDVVTEAITNASRHGLATGVTVWVDGDTPTGHSQPDVTVVVRDNGVGPRNGAPGIGTHLLDTVSPGLWRLTPGSSGGSELTVTLTSAS